MRGVPPPAAADVEGGVKGRTAAVAADGKAVNSPRAPRVGRGAGMAVEMLAGGESLHGRWRTG
jgi:hypothetical protein